MKTKLSPDDDEIFFHKHGKTFYTTFEELSAKEKQCYLRKIGKFHPETGLKFLKKIVQFCPQLWRNLQNMLWKASSSNLAKQLP